MRRALGPTVPSLFASVMLPCMLCLQSPQRQSIFCREPVHKHGGWQVPGGVWVKGATISVYTPQGVLALEPAAPGAFMLWAMVSFVTLPARVWRIACVPVLKRLRWCKACSL